jgi:hypothetical protein
VVLNEEDENKIMTVIRQIIDGISAKNESELRLKMMKVFSWEYESFPQIMNKLYYPQNS